VPFAADEADSEYKNIRISSLFFGESSTATTNGENRPVRYDKRGGPYDKWGEYCNREVNRGYLLERSLPAEHLIGCRLNPHALSVAPNCAVPFFC
jgi:hypothetical protein